MQRPNYLKASLYFCIYFLLAIIGILLLETDNLFSLKSFAAHIILSLFFTQSFILTHELGHSSFFPNRKLNYFLGHITSFISLIPFTSWWNLHRLHHKWTGWRDKDPTTEETFVNNLKFPTKKIVNLCWALSIPFFAIAYKFKIYWNLKKIEKHLPHQYYKIKREIFLYLIIYAFMTYNFSHLVVPLFPSYFLGLMIIEVLLLSQHSHIFMPVSQGENVSSIKCSEQAKYTRSLLFPQFISHWILFNFNLHESHHHSPASPCYYLKLNASHKNAKPVIQWLITVKKMSATNFIFSTDPKKEVI